MRYSLSLLIAVIFTRWLSTRMPGKSSLLRCNTTHPHILSVPTYKRIFQEPFDSDPALASPEVIAADVQTLVATMAAVAVKEGGEIPKRLR